MKKLENIFGLVLIFSSTLISDKTGTYKEKICDHDIIFVKCLKQYKANSKHLMDISYQDPYQ